MMWVCLQIKPRKFNGLSSPIKTQSAHMSDMKSYEVKGNTDHDQSIPENNKSFDQGIFMFFLAMKQS
jgi:hypothetical protein